MDFSQEIISSPFKTSERKIFPNEAFCQQCINSNLRKITNNYHFSPNGERIKHMLPVPNASHRKGKMHVQDSLAS
jgi:hypothetical protein